MPVNPMCRSWSSRIAHTNSVSRFWTRSNHSSSIPRVTPIVMRRYCVTSGSLSQRRRFSRCACLSGGTSRTFSPFRPVISAMSPPPRVAAMIPPRRGGSGRGCTGLLRPEDAAGVIAQNGGPVRWRQLQAVDDVNLLFENVMPVAAVHCGICAEEDALGAERAYGIAEDLLQRGTTGIELPPVVGPRGVHAHVLGVIGQEQRLSEEPRSEVRDEEGHVGKLLDRRGERQRAGEG